MVSVGSKWIYNSGNRFCHHYYYDQSMIIYRYWIMWGKAYYCFSNFSPPVSTEGESKGRELSNAQVPNVKLYVVVACIAALVLVAIIQASCTIFKMSRRGSSVQKVGFSCFCLAHISQHPTPTNINPIMSNERVEWILILTVYPPVRPKLCNELLPRTSCFSRLSRDGAF